MIEGVIEGVIEVIEESHFNSKIVIINIFFASFPSHLTTKKHQFLHSSKHFSDYLQNYHAIAPAACRVFTSCKTALLPHTQWERRHLARGNFHFFFPTIMFHIITRNSDQSNICITLSVIIFPASRLKSSIQGDRNQR